MSPQVRRPLRIARRRAVLVGALVAAVVVAAVVAWLVLPSGGGIPAEGATGTAVATEPGTSATVIPPPPTPEPTGPTAMVTALPPALTAVPLEASRVVDGVTVSLEGIEGIRGSGEGRGNVAGPALRVTVRIENRTGDPVDLYGVTVDLTYGEDDLPAAPLADPSYAPFWTTVPPGGSAEGVYVFSVPTENRELVAVSVSYQPGAPYAVFTGAA
jgi:hypothetical protein